MNIKVSNDFIGMILKVKREKLNIQFYIKIKIFKQ